MVYVAVDAIENLCRKGLLYLRNDSPVGDGHIQKKYVVQYVFGEKLTRRAVTNFVLTCYCYPSTIYLSHSLVHKAYTQYRRLHVTGKMRKYFIYFVTLLCGQVMCHKWSS